MFSKRILVLGLATMVLSCATVQQQIGKVALKFMTKKEADFNNIAAIGMYQTNVYAADVGITTLGTEDWEEGENLVGVQLVKPGGAIGVIALDGTVSVNGVEAKSYGGGAYYARFDADDTSTKTVTLTSSNGESTEFEISSLPSVRIKSINGNSTSPTVDLSSDLEIELDYDSEAEGKRVIVSLITSAVGAKGFAYFQSAIINNKITVPADAFKHKHIAGGGPTGKDVTNWVKGVNHLQVMILESDRGTSGQPFDYFRSDMRSFDTVPVNVTGDVEGRAWVQVKGESEESSGKFKYTANSSNAWYARPLDSDIQRIGISSLSVSGTLYKEEVETSERDNYATGYREITTTTTTFQFPELDDQYWDQFLENIYSDLTSMLRNDYEASVVDVDQITSNRIYDEFYTPQDENTKEYIAKNLRNTKRLVPNSLGEVLGDRTTALIADNGTSARLMRDMNMDAFMDVVINYQVAGGENNTIVLVPNVSYRVSGQTQGYDGTSNVWFNGNIQGPGVSFSESEFSDLNALNRIGQKDVIVKLIKQSIKELSDKQNEFGYQTVWKTALDN
ncbi:MAG TPA: hypothetical protein DF712_19545 [Balneola sp.]|nr:hypothetical protein [Bacteroidota bacterium]HCT54644.1 hypothetical protein [Balneola sp.]|tara:strand:- start:9603 stop:11288 length:1686 start_codon:yes stop_codon:yes gene_type:complete